MRFSKSIVVLLFTFLTCSSGLLFAQQKQSAQPPVKTGSKEATKPASPLDGVIDALYAAHRFEQTAISPDGKKLSWVETLVLKDGSPDFSKLRIPRGHPTARKSHSSPA
jgi:hypothetical protein